MLHVSVEFVILVLVEVGFLDRFFSVFFEDARTVGELVVVFGLWLSQHGPEVSTASEFAGTHVAGREVLLRVQVAQVLLVVILAADADLVCVIVYCLVLNVRIAEHFAALPAMVLPSHEREVLLALDVEAVPGIVVINPH